MQFKTIPHAREYELLELVEIKIAIRGITSLRVGGERDLQTRSFVWVSYPGVPPGPYERVLQTRGNQIYLLSLASAPHRQWTEVHATLVRFVVRRNNWSIRVFPGYGRIFPRRDLPAQANELYRHILGITSPWTVAKLELDPKA
jgi:hypothetical protein